jgi:hypothetical protein
MFDVKSTSTFMYSSQGQLLNCHEYAIFYHCDFAETVLLLLIWVSSYRRKHICAFLICLMLLTLSY